MYKMIFFRSVRKEINSSVPSMGEKRMGVKKETPNAPPLFHIFTNNLFCLVNTRFLVFRLKGILLSKEIIFSSKKLSKITVVIIPAIVRTAVFMGCIPIAVPKAGPKTNLIVLEKYRGDNFSNSSHIINQTNTLKIYKP